MESIVQDNAEDMLLFTFTLLVQPGIAFSCKAALAIPRLLNWRGLVLILRMI